RDQAQQSNRQGRQQCLFRGHEFALPCGGERPSVSLPVVARHAPYLRRMPSRNVLLWAVTSQALGQKHRSTHHQSLGTPAWFSAGNSRSKSSLPVPNGLCVLVWCSLSEPSESMTWTCVILPLSRSSNSISPPGSVSFVPTWLAPTAAQTCA